MSQRRSDQIRSDQGYKYGSPTPTVAYKLYTPILRQPRNLTLAQIMNILILATIAIVVFALHASASKFKPRSNSKSSVGYNPPPVTIDWPLEDDPWYAPLPASGKVLREATEHFIKIIEERGTDPARPITKEKR